MTALVKGSLSFLVSRARDISSNWPLHRQQFSLRTGWATDYASLFAGNFERILPESEIIDTALPKGRAIIAGRGGDGKTWLLRRLFVQGIGRGLLPIMLDLKQWSGSDYEEWGRWTELDVGNAADFMLRRFGGHKDFGLIELDRIAPDITKIIFVDGVNEITSQIGTQVLQLLDELAATQLNLSVIVADRLVRRPLPNPSKWSLGTLLPLKPDEVKKYLGGNADPDPILSVPFFLDAALQYGIQGKRRAQTSQKFLIEHGGLQENEIDQVARAAFDAYDESRSRVFDFAKFEQEAGGGNAAALRHSNTLTVEQNGRAYFVHHILHDYLAARHVEKMDSDAWTAEILKILTFDASSFDAVEQVFEQLEGARADAFLQRLYDWNLYAAGYALAQADEENPVVSVEIRRMIFAMLAEKRFDLMLTTRERADDALALMQLSDARPFKEAHSLNEVFEILAGVQSTQDWFNRWKELFRTEPGVLLEDDILAKIRSADSVEGWTLANVAKRMRFDDRVLGMLVGWLRGEGSEIVRWRIAHTLGAHPAEDALRALLHLLDEDANIYVRYGAIRSIVELAAKGNIDFKELVVNAIGARTDAITGQPRILGELRACLHIDPQAADATWLDFVARIVRLMFLATDNTTERDIWRKCLSRAEELYSASPLTPETVAGTFLEVG